MKIFENKNKKLLMVLGCVFAIALIITSSAISRSKVEFITIGPLTMVASSFLGVVSALASLTCIFMVCVNYRKGRVFSLIILGIHSVSMIMVVILTGDKSPIPGILNVMISVMSLLLIARQLRLTEEDSFYDSVTGILNRRGFTVELEKHLEHIDDLCVMHLGIRNLKTVSDDLGYEYTDIVLKKIAGLIEGLAGPKGLVGKLDGAEFAIAVGTDDPVSLATQMIEAVGEKIILIKGDITVKCYLNSFVGIVRYPEDAEDVDTMMKFANIALYHAARDNSSKVLLYDAKLSSELLRRTEVERIVKESLDNDYFYLVYQPQYRIIDKRLRGYETLLRLTLPNGKYVGPGEFIPVAERSELILAIDRYVLKRALREFADVIDTEEGKITLAVNVSAKSMAQPDFVDVVKATIEETGFPADCLEIEITEYSFAKSMDQTIANIKALNEMGVIIALDDFGTGYTSLAQLVNLPVSLLKIDKSLTDNITKNEVSRDFVNAVIYMGHLMGCEVLTEGVEEEDQLEILRDYECDFVQGYIWGKPLPYDFATSLYEQCFPKKLI